MVIHLNIVGNAGFKSYLKPPVILANVMLLLLVNKFVIVVAIVAKVSIPGKEKRQYGVGIE